MNKKKKALLKEWVLPLTLIGILWVTGWHKPVISFFQQMILATGIITPDTSPDAGSSLGTTSYQWQLTEAGGNMVHFSEFRGKVVFLNFFATWCPPCVAEMPGIESLYKKVGSENIVFVIISRDEEMDKTLSFMKKKEYTLPVYRARTQAPQEFGFSVLPTTFIIDKEGKIISRHAGMADYDNEDVRNLLTGLAAKP